jgi:hypothetical protein
MITHVTDKSGKLFQIVKWREVSKNSPMCLALLTPDHFLERKDLVGGPNMEKTISNLVKKFILRKRIPFHTMPIPRAVFEISRAAIQ